MIARNDETAVFTPPASNPSEKQGVLARNSLRISGGLNLYGDWKLFQSGVEKFDRSNPASYLKPLAGLLYVAGASNLLAFSKKEKSEDFSQKSQRFDKILDSAIGINNADLSDLLDDNRSAFQKFKESAPQNTLALYTAGALAMLGSGVNDFRQNSKDWGDLGYGISSTLFKAVSFLLPESSDSHQAPKTIKKDGIINWLKDKPLRIMGYGSLITDSFIFKKALTEKQKGNAYGHELQTAIAYQASDVMMAISSKNQLQSTPLTSDEFLQLKDMAASKLTTAKGDQQDKILETATEFLGREQGATQDKHKLRSAIIERAKELSWAQRSQTSESETSQIATVR